MRYYIHIPLPDDLKAEISAIEKEHQGASGSEPHITIIPPREIIEIGLEDELVKAVSFVAERSGVFPIVQKKVGYFGNKETVYAGVEITTKLLTLHRMLVAAVSSTLKPSVGTQFVDLSPHITLATRLSPEKGERAWSVLKDKTFFSQFVCDRIVLLNKSKMDKRWQVVSEFRLDG